MTSKCHRRSGLAFEAPHKGGNGCFHGGADSALVGIRFEAQQVANVYVAAHQRDELLSGKPGIAQDQGARCDRALQVELDLETLAFRSGAPEHLAEPRES